METNTDKLLSLKEHVLYLAGAKICEIPSRDWLSYFKANKESLLRIPWELQNTLTAKEKKIITKSIQQFQLGEGSDGKGLITRAEEYSKKSGDYAYFEAIQLFIKEEQRHSLTLGRFMIQENVLIKQKHWVDTIFRKIRKLADLEVCIIVLVCAEIIAKTYYKALKSATSSALLQKLCDQILQDETPHVEFQMSTLWKIREKQSTTRMYSSVFIHHALMVVTVFVVWSQHREVLKAGKYSFKSFFAECYRDLKYCNKIATGKL